MSARPHTKRIFCGIGTRFANPFVYAGVGEIESFDLFRGWIGTQPDLLHLIRDTLDRQPLSCPRCETAACHCNIIGAIARGDWDDRIPEKPIFVFGSNTAGRHGKGAALDAVKHFGATLAIGEGPQGQAYAIPTKDNNLRTLPLDQIAQSVDSFVRYANAHPHYAFRVTRIGCGLAGYKPEQIRPMFSNCPSNVELPGAWLEDVTRIIVAGSRDFSDYSLLERRLDWYLQHLDSANIEIVSGGARGADTLGERYAIERGLQLRRFPALWEQNGNKAAGPLRNRLMAWYGTHLVAFSNGSPGTRNMMQTAQADGLHVRHVSF